MKQIKYLITVLVFGMVITGCGSSKVSYEVTKDIYLNASRDNVIDVLKTNNLDVVEATKPFDGFVVDCKSYSGSESNNSEEDFFNYYSE